METDHKGCMRVKPHPEFDGDKFFVPKDKIPDKAAFIGAFCCVLCVAYRVLRAWGEMFAEVCGGGGSNQLKKHTTPSQPTHLHFQTPIPRALRQRPGDWGPQPAQVRGGVRGGVGEGEHRRAGLAGGLR